ncbi:amino acid ABC transporter substrate-binding protein [Methylobacterium sp. J-048]|uniref:amino acid ABC transporter substrate-binding protein n=1 Tax=Methylobacterium sp. J-048 TaxID=2836635 RepID=UPI001FB915AA|nr:amino acid ABC transporter substrate-binding protein [Methylobacterium sp. J-048]MCJ2059711.1 amino acid ABC transporter substrate-binding protein [Methylobacterium sp. J-048]
MTPKLACALRPALSALAIVSGLGAAIAASPTLEKIRSSGTLTLGYREASIPFSYLGPDQKPVGMSLDLCAAVAQRVRTELKLPELKTAFVAVNASNRIPLLQNGTVDIECGSTTNTAERQKQVAFSVATFVSQPRWLTLRASGIADVHGLRGRTVVITQGSLNMLLAQKLNAADGLDLTILQARDHAESLLMLRTGRAAAWCEDDVLLAGARATALDPKALAFLPASPGANYYYGLMLARDDPEFKALVDGALKAQMASGTFAKLYEQWFLNSIPPAGQNLDLPMSEALQFRVRNPSDALKP